MSDSQAIRDLIAAFEEKFAPLASPAFTGSPTAPTPAPGDNDTSIATTAFVAAALLPLAYTGELRAEGRIVADTTVGPGDCVLLATAAGGNVTINLPEIVNGRILIIKKVDGTANTVTLDGFSTQPIDGAPTFALTTLNQTVRIFGFNGGWWII